MSMIKPDEFFSLLESGDKTGQIVRFGTVAANHTTGRPAVVFDGMDAASTKKYPYIASYTPAANDRVLIIKGVIIGKIV